MGDTQADGTYTGPYWQNHDYFVPHYSNNDNLCTIGPLEYDTAWGPPNDSNTISFKQSS
jgi:hypothetical protein